MKNIILCLFMMVACTNIEDEKNKEATISFKDIQQFPQEIIITQFSKNFVIQTDTFHVENENDTHIPLGIDRPKYVYVQKEGETQQFFLESGSELIVSKEKDRYSFQGDLVQENNYLQDIRNNKELAEKNWDYSRPFKEFREQVAVYFEFKNNLLEENLGKKNTGYFYQLSKIEDRAFHNSILLDYIRTQSPTAERDSLFFEYFDKGLLNYNEMRPYLDANYLMAFYRKKGVEYFMRKSNGKVYQDPYKQKDPYVEITNTVADSFNQPLKSILLYSHLNDYLLDFDYAPDSLDLTPPKILIDKYKNDLHEEAFSALNEKIDSNQAKKKSYAKGVTVPKFDLKNSLGVDYLLDPADFEKLVLIDLWASWCGPCLESFPKINELEKKYPDKLEVISISIDKNFELYKNGLDKYEVPGKTRLYAQNAFTSDIAKFFQVTAIPRYILIDSDGNVLNPNIPTQDIENVLKANF